MDSPIDPKQHAELALVTGATGFIGQYLCSALLEEGFRVRALVRNEAAAKALSAKPGLETIETELSEAQTISDACKDASLVFHLAGVAHVGSVSDAEFDAVNVEGTRSVLEACLSASVPRLVYFSSILAQQLDYADNNRASAYARSKRKAEELLLSAASEKFSPKILRPVNVYGPGMKGNIATLVRRIRAGGLPPLPKLENSINLVSVNSLCDAAILAARDKSQEGATFTVCDPQPYTLATLETSIYDGLGRKKPSWSTPRMVFYAAAIGAQVANSLGIWKNDLGLRTYRNLVGSDGIGPVSCEKIASELGYKPTATFSSELPAILAAL